MTIENQKSKIKNKIDWDAVKQRLKQSETALDKALTVDEERIQRIFRERAEQLAARRSEVGQTRATLRILVFRLSPERYGIDLRCVTQVVPFAECTPVPESPPQLLGVTNLRGDIRSVVDLRGVLELPAAENDAGGYILFIRNGGGQVGFRVDQIESVQSIDGGKLTVPSEGPVELPTAYLKGITPERIIVLNTEEILEHPLF